MNSTNASEINAVLKRQFSSWKLLQRITGKTHYIGSVFMKKISYVFKIIMLWFKNAHCKEIAENKPVNSGHLSKNKCS